LRKIKEVKMKYEEYIALRGRAYNWIVVGALLILFLGIWIGAGIGVIVVFLVYGLFCSLKYIQFIDKHPDNNKIYYEIDQSRRWWSNLEWKEKLIVYRKHKGVIR
jgi:hypothetical protein